MRGQFAAIERGLFVRNIHKAPELPADIAKEYVSRNSKMEFDMV